MRTGQLLRGVALGWLVGPLGAPGCGAPDEVQGVAARLWMTEDGLSGEDSISLDGPALAALVPVGDGYEELPGQGSSDGRFLIPGVPEGPYLLRFSDDLAGSSAEQASFFLWTDARELDLGYRFMGQPWAAAEVPPLPLRFSGLRPAEPDDVLEIVVSSRRWRGYWSALPEGAEELSWPEPTPPALPGERVTARQLARIDTDELQGQVLVRQGAAVVQEGGAPLDIALLAPPLRVLSLSLAASGLLSDPLPGHGAPRSTLHVYADVDPTGATLGGAEEQLRLHGRDGGLRIQGQSFGDAAPAAWTRHYLLSTLGGRLYRAPGALDEGAYCEGGVERSGPLEELGGAAPPPLLSPPQELQVDAQGALEQPLQVRATALLRWRPPATGEASFYRLQLRRLVLQPDGHSYGLLTATILTSATELRLPPGLLRPGEAYTLMLSAFSGIAEDVTRAPRLAAFARPRAASHLCSALLLAR